MPCAVACSWHAANIRACASGSLFATLSNAMTTAAAIDVVDHEAEEAWASALEAGRVAEGEERELTGDELELVALKEKLLTTGLQALSRLAERVGAQGDESSGDVDGGADEAFIEDVVAVVMDTMEV